MKGKANQDNSRTVLCAAVLMSVVFACFYHYGVGEQQREGMTKNLSIQKRNTLVRASVKKCQQQRDQTMVSQIEHWADKNLSKYATQLYNENNVQEKLVDTLTEEVNTWEMKNIKCSEDRAQFEKQMTDEKRESDSRFKELDSRSRNLIDGTKRLAGTKGMRSIILIQNIVRLNEETAALRKSLGMENIKMDESYLKDLVAKWKRMDTTKMAIDETVKEVNSSEVEIRLTPYDSDLHAAQTFFPSKSESGDYQKPGWNGRYGTQDLRHGTFVGSNYTPITTIDKQMRILYNYAICAVGLNITKFMYPTSFKTCEDCPVESLHHYIETPVFLFCDDCAVQHHTNEFKLLCRGYLDRDQYGSALFWRARSRLMFKGRYSSAADEEGTRLGVVGEKPSLAVRIPRAEAFNTKICQNPKRFNTMCFEKILKPAGTVEVLEGDEHCYPELQKYADAINKRIESEPQLVVYISTDATELVCVV